MEQLNLHLNPFKCMDLQWFGDPEPEPGPEPAPDPEPEPELKADGTFLAQAPDKYKRDQKYLKDLLQHRNWGEVLDRLYAAEAKVPTEPGLAGEPIPEPPGGYELTIPAFPEELQGDSYADYRSDLVSYLEATGEEINALAHELRLPNSVAQRVSDFFCEKQFAVMQAAVEQYSAQKAEGLQALKVAWKAGFSPNMEMCRRVIATFDDSGTLVADLEAEGGLENKPSLVKFLYKVSQAMGEGVLVPGGTVAGPAMDAADEKKAEHDADIQEMYPNTPILGS